MKDPKNVVPGQQLPAVHADISAKDLAFCSSEEARELLAYEQALSFMVLPLSIIRLGSSEVLTVVSREELAHEEVQALRFLCGCTLRVIRCAPNILTEAIFIAYRDNEQELGKTAGRIAAVEPSVEEPLSEQLPSFGEYSVPGLLTKLIEVGVAKGASDLTLTPEDSGSIAGTMRLDGRVMPLAVDTYRKPMHLKLLNRVRVLSGLSLTEKDAPQDGQFTVELPHGKAEVRFHIFPTIFGAKICFRLPVARSIPLLKELGLTSQTLRYLEGTLHRLEGGVFLSGPTGSGKTTTLYSIISELAKRELTIVSLEDPVEQRISGVSQSDLSKLPNVSYARGLREVLRQDPDVILVGEIRDSESARVALEAASTGQLLLSSVHGGRTRHVIERLIRLSGDRMLVAHAVSLVIGQRLLPMLCASCKVIDLQSTRKFGRTLYQPAQCEKCSYTGFSGRIVIDESLFMSPEIEQLVVSENLEEKALEGSPFHRSLIHSLESALVSGRLDLDTAQRIVPFG